MKKIILFLFVLALAGSISMLSSCSIENEDRTTRAISKSDIVGNWTITKVSGNNTKNWIDVGSMMTFYPDGSCTTGCTEENTYRIDGGKLCTYHDEEEPMFVYSLLFKDDSYFTFKMEGTKNDTLSIRITIRKV